MAVGLPAKSNLDASIFFTVFKSITIHGSYVGNRQDAIECINIAASGAVKVHYQLKSIDDLEKCVFSFIVAICLSLTLSLSLKYLCCTRSGKDCRKNCLDFAVNSIRNRKKFYLARRQLDLKLAHLVGHQGQNIKNGNKILSVGESNPAFARSERSDRRVY